MLIGLLVLLCLTAACASENPAVAPSPSASATSAGSPEPQATPSGDPNLLAQGSSGTGIDYKLIVVPGNPVCVQLRRTDAEGDFLICDESSEADFNGDDNLRYAFGGLNPEQVPKFVIGITSDDVEKVRIDLPEGESPTVATEASTQAPGRRFFVVMLNPDPPQEVQAVRGLDAAGKTVAGFAFGPPDEGPTPLPTG